MPAELILFSYNDLNPLRLSVRSLAIEGQHYSPATLFGDSARTGINFDRNLSAKTRSTMPSLQLALKLLAFARVGSYVLASEQSTSGSSESESEREGQRLRAPVPGLPHFTAPSVCFYKNTDCVAAFRSMACCVGMQDNDCCSGQWLETLADDWCQAMDAYGIEENHYAGLYDTTNCEPMLDTWGTLQYDLASRSSSCQTPSSPLEHCSISYVSANVNSQSEESSSESGSSSDGGLQMGRRPNGRGALMARNKEISNSKAGHDGAAVKIGTTISKANGVPNGKSGQTMNGASAKSNATQAGANGASPKKCVAPNWISDGKSGGFFVPQAEAARIFKAMDKKDTRALSKLAKFDPAKHVYAKTGTSDVASLNGQ